jgi:metalloendopeptidase OMA1, mitochondrial
MNSFKISAFLILLVLPCLCSCAKDMVTGKTTLNYYTIDQEPKLGASVLKAQLADLEKHDKPVDVKASSGDYALINEIVRKIAAVSHYPNFPYEVHLADVPIVNAWCAPGGKIMVYAGLWDPKTGLVKHGDKNELAAVLAHEIAHATARHVTETISRNMTIAMTGAVVQSAIAAGGYAQGADMFGEVFSGGLNLFVPSYSRKNEKEADKIGLMYMAKAGYDPRVAVELWKRAAGKGKEKTSIYASHPASGERAKSLEKYLPEAMRLYEESQQK